MERRDSSSSKVYKWFQIELHHRGRVAQAEAFQHLRVHHSKHRDGFVLVRHGGGASWEEAAVFATGLYCVASLAASRHAHHLHHAVHHPVCHLEPGDGSAEEDGGAANVPCAHVRLRVQLHHIRNLKNLDWQRRLLVAAEGLEQPRHEAGAHNLEVECLGVGDLRRLGQVVLPVHHLEVVGARAQDPREHLREPGLGQLPPHQIREAVDGLLLRHRHRPRHLPLEIVVAVSNGHVLHDVARVEHVAARRGHFDAQLVAIGGGVQAHLGEQLGSLV
mmetsp:Transcript_40120/g.76694  ORF Transcript_40120/g.76694 Transcript_40120/m.76694 type:complete len:275 (-) Transcript_40120:1024-1848(-)